MTIDHSDGLRTLLPPLALTIPSFSVGSCPTPMSVFPKVAPGTSPGDSSARNVLGAFSSPMRKSSLYFTFPDAIQSPMVARNSASCSWKTASPGCAAAPPACKHKNSGFQGGSTFTAERNATLAMHAQCRQTALGRERSALRSPLLPALPTPSLHRHPQRPAATSGHTSSRARRCSAVEALPPTRLRPHSQNLRVSDPANSSRAPLPFRSRITRNSG